MMEKYLPIGTVVQLKEAKKRLMIIGFCPTTLKEDKKTVYDYCGCLFPEGLLSSDETILFNHEDIDNLYCYGLVDQEQKDFIEELKRLVEEESANESSEDIEIPVLDKDTIEK